jgi:hypothetical protein
MATSGEKPMPIDRVSRRRATPVGWVTEKPGRRYRPSNRSRQRSAERRLAAIAGDVTSPVRSARRTPRNLAEG